MHKPKNLYNQIHGELIVVDKETGEHKLGKAITWYCLCSCGNACYARTFQLTSGVKRSCGCSSRVYKRKQDLTGQRFGKLTVICEHHERRHFPNGKSKAQWSCQCDCGNITLGTAGSLKGGYKQSCGCLRGEARRERAKKEEQAKKDPASILSDSWNVGGC